MLIMPNDLHERLREGTVVVFDCRFSLSDPEAGRKQYDAGHIPGAQYLDLEKDLSDMRVQGRGRHPLPDAQDLADKLGHAGVSNDKTVVVYDGGEGMATRAWWLIRYLGHDDVRVLDGGLSAWLADGYETSTEAPTPQATMFTPHVRSDWILDASEVERIVSGERKASLIDARAPERYRGEQEPMDPRAGHIPGAGNAPWQAGLDEMGRWRGAEEQRKRFEPLLKDGAEAVSYCGSGVTACANLFALELAGIHGAKLYPGSWSEWSSDPEHEIATGSK